MQMLTRVGAALQTVFQNCAKKSAEVSQVIQRKRKFDAVSLAKTFVLGFLENPTANENDLAAMAAQCGVDISPQAIAQRHTPRLVKFLEELFRRATQVAVAADTSLAPLLERFSAVQLVDSSTVTLPDCEQDRFPGCGGSYESGKAAIKLQTELDLKSGAISHLEIEPGRCADGASSRQQGPFLPGSLRITDLGYFQIAVFQQIAACGAFFLSRLQMRTGLKTPEGIGWDVLAWLNSLTGRTLVDEAVLLGKTDQFPCRMIAWRVPPEQANRRRQKLRASLRAKKGRTPSAYALAWCDWTILITNLPPEQLSVQEAIVLYRARWQVELLFKRWKSLGQVALLDGTSDEKTLVRLWSRLTAALVTHWLSVMSVWSSGGQLSLYRVAKRVRKHMICIAAHLSQPDQLLSALKGFCHAVSRTCRRNKRKKPGTIELLNNPNLLDFRLT